MNTFGLNVIASDKDFITAEENLSHSLQKMALSPYWRIMQMWYRCHCSGRNAYSDRGRYLVYSHCRRRFCTDYQQPCYCWQTVLKDRRILT